MDLIGKNGKIDGVLAAQVLLDGGVFFFKPGELYYDGSYHQIKGMQANTAAMRDFPGIFDQMDQLAPQLVNLMVYVEKNISFRVKYEDLGREIHEFLQNEDMTGMTFLYLFKWHLLALNRSATGITVSMESRVKNGIPDAEAKVRQLVEMLIAYDGTDPASMRITVIEVDANGREVPKAEPLPMTTSIPEPAPTSAPSSVNIDPLPPTADARTISVAGTVTQGLTADAASVVPDPLPLSSPAAVAEPLPPSNELIGGAVSAVDPLPPSNELIAGAAPAAEPLPPSNELIGGAVPTADPLPSSNELIGGAAPAVDPLPPSNELIGGTVPAMDPLPPSNELIGGVAGAADPIVSSNSLIGGTPAMDPLPPSNELIGGAAPVADSVAVSNSLLGGTAPAMDSVAVSNSLLGGAPQTADPVSVSNGLIGEAAPAVDSVAISNSLLGGTPQTADPMAPSNGLLGGEQPQAVAAPMVDQTAPVSESIPISVTAQPVASETNPAFVDPVVSSASNPAFVDPVVSSASNPAFVDPVVSSASNPAFVDPVVSSASNPAFVDPVVSSAPNPIPAPVPVPMPIPSAVPTAVPTMAGAPSAPLPPELSQYLDEIKPKMQKIIAEWSQYSDDFVQKISEEQFSGFSDPKIKEYRDEIGEKQEDFGEELEEILENLNEHIEQIDAQGVSEDVMKSVLDQERECYSGLLDLKVNLETIGEVDYRITRRCSKNHEKWEKIYNELPSVVKAVEEERKNQERQRITNEIAAVNEKIEAMNREYADAKATLEISQAGLESKQDNLDQDRQKLMVRAEAAIGMVEDKIKENSNLIEELEVENKRLEDELRDAGSFALGRKRTIRDTIDYNKGFISKYKEVAKNLEIEKSKVTEEWNGKLDNLVGDNDHLQTLVTENTEKMQMLEKSIAEEQGILQKLQAELAAQP